MLYPFQQHHGIHGDAFALASSRRGKFCKPLTLFAALLRCPPLLFPQNSLRDFCGSPVRRFVKGHQSFFNSTMAYTVMPLPSPRRGGANFASRLLCSRLCFDARRSSSHKTRCAIFAGALYVGSSKGIRAFSTAPWHTR